MPESSAPQAPSGAARPGNSNAASPRTVLELRVRNHPGTLSHVAGLFTRRGFNLEAIRCAPEREDPSQSRMLLLVDEAPRLEQLERQLQRLHDVLEVRRRADADPAGFAIQT